MNNKEQTHDLLSLRDVVWVFLAFAVAYFLSALLRAITATLSPTLSGEFGLQARDLGLLAGGYFLGFSMTQLPLGHWLDAHGPKKVVLRFLALAVVGCVAFALSTNFAGLLLSRMLIGAGVSACLMAPLTGYRRWLTVLGAHLFGEGPPAIAFVRKAGGEEPLVQMYPPLRKLESQLFAVEADAVAGRAHEAPLLAEGFACPRPCRRHRAVVA